MYLYHRQKIEKENLKAATLGDSDAVQVGEWCMAIGNPLGMTSSVTTGSISALNRSITDSDGKTYTAIKLGDPTGDGKINILDSLRIRKYIIGEVNLENEYLSAADSTGDTKVNILDSLKIRKYIINEATIDI